MGLTLFCAGRAFADGPKPPESIPFPQSPPPAPDSDCQLLSHPTGRLAAVTCGPLQEPLRGGGHRLQQFTGTLVTYYEHGGVHEVLTLKDGLLDGIVEVYDSLGHLGERSLFQAGKRQHLGVLPAIPPPGSDSAAPAASAAYRTRVSEELGVGMGLRAVASLAHNAHGTFLQLGPALDVFFRIVPRWRLEMRVEFHHS